MKTAIVLILALVLATVAFAAKEDPGPGDPVTLDLLDCAGAPLLSCGMDFVGNDPVMGGNVETYSCTGLNYGQCSEVVYEICLGSTGTLTVQMGYNHTADNDLDLFLLGSCNENDCLDASLGVSGFEEVTADLPPGTYWVVVDGWSDNCDGLSTHDITVICDSPCTVSTESSTWTEVKDRYR